MINEYNLKEIDDAGDTLISDPKNEDALTVLNSWRELHTHFLFDFIPQTSCNPADIVNSNGCGFDITVSSRAKRAIAIIDKLKRIPRLKLSQIQDIVGMRYVLTPTNSQSDNNRLFTDFIERQKEFLSDCFVIERVRDLVMHPCKTGYRSVHFVLKNVNSERPEFDGLRFELQIRTRYQHLWAMAIETVDKVYGKRLKVSKTDDADGWSDFFKCVSALFAVKENMPVVEIYANDDETTINNKLTALNKDSFIAKLSSLPITVRESSGTNYDYCILEVDFKRHTIHIFGVNSDTLDLALAFYKSREQNPDYVSGDVDIVLVSVKDVQYICEAYPSYFLDIKEFLSLL
ncbi:MAG: RelA/SpoT domain-containing protein [Planctomycetaceae bacterium]|jgi:ppGpp synthetase/RelA/SpoT-type nucleotidyltranferase|nr:RelA/SpoT domain-containing protein [Planctomycetaceae bacterium]